MIPMRISDKDFTAEVMQSNRLTLAYFHSSSFATSSIDKIMYEAIADIYDDIIKALILDFDRCPLTKRKFGVSTAPTIIYLVNGLELARQEGVFSVNQMHNVIKQYLADRENKDDSPRFGKALF